MITRQTIEYYLNPKLGIPKISKQGLRYNCPKPGCDQGNKYNLEVNLSGNAPIFNCWACRYSGFIKKIFEDYASDLSWNKIPELKNHNTKHFEDDKDDLIDYPKKIVSYSLSTKATEILLNRGMDHKELRRRDVGFVNDIDSKYYDCIVFPFKENDVVVGACMYDINSKKYKNVGKLKYVPYKEFINKKYPIMIVEGVFDCLSCVNAIPLLRTDINKATLDFLYNCNIIQAVDNSIDLDQYLNIMNKLDKSNIKSLTLFDMHEYKDPNEFMLDEPEMFSIALAEAFNIANNN